MELQWGKWEPKEIWSVLVKAVSSVLKAVYAKLITELYLNKEASTSQNTELKARDQNFIMYKSRLD